MVCHLVIDDVLPVGAFTIIELERVWNKRFHAGYAVLVFHALAAGRVTRETLSQIGVRKCMAGAIVVSQAGCLVEQVVVLDALKAVWGRLADLAVWQAI